MPKIEDLENKIKELEDKVATLEDKVTVKDTEFSDLSSQIKEAERLLKNHRHQGEETPEITLGYLRGGVKTISSVPSEAPSKGLDEQIIIYKSGATKRFYIYDFVNGAWYYVALS